jgi:signal transduction histidine kinase
VIDPLTNFSWLMARVPLDQRDIIEAEQARAHVSIGDGSSNTHTTDKKHAEAEKDRRLRKSMADHIIQGNASPLSAEILANMSHELRGPLTSIKGYAATLLPHEQRLSPEECHAFLQIIHTHHREVNKPNQVQKIRCSGWDLFDGQGALPSAIPGAQQQLGAQLAALASALIAALASQPQQVPVPQQSPLTTLFPVMMVDLVMRQKPA